MVANDEPNDDQLLQPPNLLLYAATYSAGCATGDVTGQGEPYERGPCLAWVVKGAESGGKVSPLYAVFSMPPNQFWFTLFCNACELICS